MGCFTRAMLLLIFLFLALVYCKIRHYNFTLCASKSIVTIIGKFPGPTLYAREDDNVIVTLINNVQCNVTIHWQLRTGWAAGPTYITQCPIQPGQSYVYNFTLTGQRGIILCHAHISWLRATIHGASVIFPKKGVPYPFPKPHKEKIIVLSECWKADVEAVINQAIQTGLTPNISDAPNTNGQTGAVPSCSSC